ncbi:MAG: DUF4870 domain-containing protein [Planctomycetota bacterium]
MTESIPPTSTTTAPPVDADAREFLERWRLAPNRRVRDAMAGDIDRVVACAIHLWPLWIAVIGPFAVLLPVVLWLAFRRASVFVDDHGREAMNAQLTMLALLLVPCLGWIALIPWTVAWLASMVRAAVAAAGSELFRYPALLRPIR